MKRIAAIALLSLGLHGCATVPTPADTLYLGGKIYTVDADRSWAEAIAVRGDRIVYVGNDEDASRYRGTSTDVVALDGAMVMPGIHDAHGHLLIGGLQFTSNCLLPTGAAPAEMVAALRSCARDAEAGDWIVAGTFWSNQFPNDQPNRAFLDEAFPDNPVYLHEGSVHHALVNARALAVAGIDKSTPNPPGGSIPKGVDDELTGELIESATWLVTQHIPPVDAALNLEAIRWASREYNRFGITSVQEAAANRPTLEALKAVDEAGNLTLRVAAHIILESPKFGGESNRKLEALLAERERYASPHVAVDYVKMWLDGSPTAPYFTEAGYDEGAGGPNLEHMLVPPDRLNQILVDLDSRGIKAKMHVAGAGAAHLALNAIEAARRVQPESKLMHETAHTNLVIPDDFRRFAELNAVAEVSPTVWHIFGSTLGSPPQSAWQFRTLLEAGAHMTVGSDWPVTREPNFFPALQGMLEHGDESVDIKSVIDAVTINGAVAMGWDDTLGSIEVGKIASFIVLSQNVLEVPTSQIEETKVLRTIFEGREVFTADDVEAK